VVARKKKGEAEPLTFADCMQIGLGRLRFSPSVFYDMTFIEFCAAAQGNAKHEEHMQQMEWERTRWLATVMMQPHSKKGQSIKPRDLTIFPWEKKEKKKKRSNKLLEHTLKAWSNGTT